MKVENLAITRKFNIGNYQTIDIHVEASLNETDNPIEKLHILEKLIMDFWEGRTSNLAAQKIGENPIRREGGGKAYER